MRREPPARVLREAANLNRALTLGQSPRVIDPVAVPCGSMTMV
jgi:hypothetical protein